MFQSDFVFCLSRTESRLTNQHFDVKKEKTCCLCFHIWISRNILIELVSSPLLARNAVMPQCQLNYNKTLMKCFNRNRTFSSFSLHEWLSVNVDQVARIQSSHHTHTHTTHNIQEIALNGHHLECGDVEPSFDTPRGIAAAQHMYM